MGFWRVFLRRPLPPYPISIGFSLFRSFLLHNLHVILYNNVQMAADLSKLRQQLRRSHDALGRLLRHFLRDPPMTKGTLYLQKRRCGKPNCRCARGQPHVAWVLTRSQDGVTHTYMVGPEQRARLRQLTDEYRRYQRARASLVKAQAHLLDLADQIAELRMVSWPPSTP